MAGNADTKAAEQAGLLVRKGEQSSQGQQRWVSVEGGLPTGRVCVRRGGGRGEWGDLPGWVRSPQLVSTFSRPGAGGVIRARRHNGPLCWPARAGCLRAPAELRALFPLLLSSSWFALCGPFNHTLTY